MSFNWKIESLLREKREFEMRFKEMITRNEELAARVKKLEERDFTPALASWSTIPDRLEQLETLSSTHTKKIEQLEQLIPKRRKHEIADAASHTKVETTKG